MEIEFSKLPIEHMKHNHKIFSEEHDKAVKEVFAKGYGCFNDVNKLINERLKVVDGRLEYKKK